MFLLRICDKLMWYFFSFFLISRTNFIYEFQFYLAPQDFQSHRAGTGAAGILNSWSFMFWMNGFANQLPKWLMGKYPIVWRIVWQRQPFAFMRSRGWVVESPERHWWSLISSTFPQHAASYNQVFLRGTSNILIFSTHLWAMNMMCWTSSSNFKGRHHVPFLLFFL